MSFTRTLGLPAIIAAAVAIAVMWSCERRDRPEPPPPPPNAAHPRVAALSPALAATLRWLALDKLIVARHGYDAWSDPTLPVAGDQGGIDYEALLAVRPTHVLIEWGERPPPERLVALSKERGWTVLNLSTLTLDDIAAGADLLESTLAPGAVSTHPEGSPSDRLRRAWSPRPGPALAGAGRVLLLLGASPPTALGPGSAHHQILANLGAIPALERGAPYMTLDAEDVAALAPDVIVLIEPGEPRRDDSTPRTPPTPETLLARLGVLAQLPIPSVRTGRVLLADDPEALLPSASLVRFADGLHDGLSRWVASGAPEALPPR